MNEIQCYSCQTEYTYEDEHVIVCCDTVDGQYVVYEATKCPNCGVENKIYEN